MPEKAVSRYFERFVRGFFGRSSRASAAAGGSSILSTSGSGPGLDLGCGTADSVAEATEDMVSAGAFLIRHYDVETESSSDLARKVWRAMRDARPRHGRRS